MKKLSAIFLVLCILLSVMPLAVSAESATTDLLPLVNLGDATLADGVMTAPNRGGDTAYLTDIYIEKGRHVYVEATVTMTDGAWGLLFSESGAGNPFGNWFCMNFNVRERNSRLFFINSAANTGVDGFWEASIAVSEAQDGQPHTLGLEILESGAMKLYRDGKLVSELPNANFNGATLGLMTWEGGMTCTSFTMKEGAPDITEKAGTPRELEYISTTNLLDASVLTHPSINDYFIIEDAKMHTNGRGGGDRAIMSDLYIAKGDHVYIEVTAKILEGGAWGLLFNTSGVDTPFSNWFCMNADGYKTRMFDNGSGYNLASPVELYVHDWSMGQNMDVTLGLEITPDGTFYLTVNGYTYGERKCENWNGAYIGLMTWEANVEFTEATYNVVKGLKQEHNPNTGDQVVYVIMAMAVVSVAAVVCLTKKKAFIG